DRLEVRLAGEDEVAVGQRGIGIEGPLHHMSDAVLDESGLQVGVLDDKELVGPLQELEDRRAHRALDDADEILRVDSELGSEVELAAAALVVGRERYELEAPLDLA